MHEVTLRRTLFWIVAFAGAAMALGVAFFWIRDAVNGRVVGWPVAEIVFIGVGIALMAVALFGLRRIGNS